MERYEAAKKQYRKCGVDPEEAMRILKEIPISIHCWQGDDVTGFENAGEALSGRDSGNGKLSR